MKIANIVAAVAAACTFITVPSARATETDTITLAGKPVMRIRAGLNGDSPADRADAVRERLAAILARDGASRATVSVVQAQPGQDALIYVGGEPLVRVDKSLSTANGMDDPRDLAVAWARNLAAALPRLAR